MNHYLATTTSIPTSRPKRSFSMPAQGPAACGSCGRFHLERPHLFVGPEPQARWPAVFSQPLQPQHYFSPTWPSSSTARRTAAPTAQQCRRTRTRYRGRRSTRATTTRPPPVASAGAGWSLPQSCDECRWCWWRCYGGQRRAGRSAGELTATAATAPAAAAAAATAPGVAAVGRPLLL